MSRTEGCPTGKVVYASRKQARTAMKRTSQPWGGSSPYRCPHCGEWHLGRKLPKHAQRNHRRRTEPDERRLDAEE